MRLGGPMGFGRMCMCGMVRHACFVLPECRRPV